MMMMMMMMMMCADDNDDDDDYFGTMKSITKWVDDHHDRKRLAISSFGEHYSDAKPSRVLNYWCFQFLANRLNHSFFM